MKNINIFSKSKEDLKNKIDQCLVHEDVDTFYKERLKKWKDWYETNNHLIQLDDLNETNKFYRAYWHLDTVGIQIWKENDDQIVEWEKNIYISNPDFLDDPDTIILNDGRIVEELEDN